MADQWYFERDGKKNGPFSAARLKELAAAGQVRPGDTVWKQGIDRGVPAAKVRGLFPDAAAKDRPAEGAVPTEDAPSPPPAAAPPPEAPAPADAGATPEEQPTPAPAPEDQVPAEDAAAPAASAAPPSPSPPPVEKRKGRVISVKGGVILSQDGAVVRYRKKCLKCGFDDRNATTMPIRGGVTRVNFFCPKCRKNQQIEVHGVL
jgi:hypothetical protein